MIYVAADIHGRCNLDVLNQENFPAPPCADDYLVLCGDVGLVWEGGVPDSALLDWYEAQPYTTLYVDGNHENHDLLAEMSVTEWNGGKVHLLSAKVVHLMRGQAYDLDGTRIFCFGGAYSLKRLSGDSSVPLWDSEMPSEHDYEEGLRNLDALGRHVDFIFTHTCPTACLAHLHSRFYEHEGVLNDYLDRVATTVRWRRWYFGHFHTDLDLGNFRAVHRRVLRVE